MSKNLKSVIYVRVASLQSSTPSYEGAAQEEECRRHAAEAGYKVMAVFTDLGESGTARQRNGLNDMLDFLSKAEEPGMVVLAADQQRLSRDVGLTAELLSAIRATGAMFEAANS